MIYKMYFLEWWEICMVSFKGRSVVSIRDFTREEVEHILDAAEKMEEFARKGSDLLKGRILATLFFEPSTRTRISFETAMKRLGGGVVGFAEPGTTSAVKGENLSDTIRVVESYADTIVLRHPLEGAARLASELSKIPIINAGSGSEEHPTQALLDLLTIRREKKSIDGLSVALVGDLKYGRTVHSLSYALSMYDVDLYLVSPPLLRMRSEAIDDVKKQGVKVTEVERIEKVVENVDVIYITRIQRERIPDAAEYEKVRGSYKIDLDLLGNAKSDVIIMHPLPRVDEIDVEVDRISGAVYFKQPWNGVLIRMALLALILGGI